VEIESGKHRLDLSRATSVAVTRWMALFNIDDTGWELMIDDLTPEALQYLRDKENKQNKPRPKRGKG